MEPVTLIVTALVAGAAAGVSNTASMAVQDSFQALYDAARRRLVGGGRAADAKPDSGEGVEPAADAVMLDAYLEDPVGQHGRLVQALAAAGAGQDTELIDAARQVFAVVLAGCRQGGRKYTVDAHDAKGIMISDRGTQTNTFS